MATQTPAPATSDPGIISRISAKRDKWKSEADRLKGEHAAAYSGFEGRSDDDEHVPLADWLKQRGVGQVDVVGIATDHCVRATALDAQREGLHTTVLLDLTAGVARPTTDAALAQLREVGVRLLGSPTVA